AQNCYKRERFGASPGLSLVTPVNNQDKECTMQTIGRALVLSLALGLVAGCEGKGPDNPPIKPPEYNTSSDLKTRLEEMAKTGIGGSGAMGMKESIDKAIRPTNAALADDLQNDLDELTKTTDVDQVKAIATRMIGKLP